MDRLKNLYFRRNVVGVASVEFLWGLGFPIVLESTFLQLFLKNLGASSFLIGIVPALFIFSISCFPIFGSYLTRNIRLKKNIVLIVHLLPAIAIFMLGCLMQVVDQKHILVLFFVFYAIFSIALGLAIPIWLNYVARIFSEGKTVPGLGYMMLAQNIGKIISSFFILKVVEKYAFSQTSCAVIFMLTGGVFAIGAFFFLFTKEFADKNDPGPDNQGFRDHIRSVSKEIIQNKPFVTYLIADLDCYVMLAVLSFYANYAVEFYSVDQAIAAGVFVGCIYAGSVTINILLGTLNLLQIKQKFILAKCLSLIALTLLILSPAKWCFFLISFLLGMVRAIRNVVYTPSIKKFSGKTDATAYFALAPLLTLPIGFGLPLMFGKTLDLLSPMGADSYKILFGIAIGCILVTFYFTLKTNYGDQSETKPKTL